MIRWLVFLALVLAVLRVARSLLPVPRPELAGGPRPGARGWDPWAVLGLAAGASHDEITAAYRDLMKRYHPDRVADLGDELRQLAHEKTIEIQRAYDELSR